MKESKGRERKGRQGMAIAENCCKKKEQERRINKKGVEEKETPDFGEEEESVKESKGEERKARKAGRAPRPHTPSSHAAHGSPLM